MPTITKSIGTTGRDYSTITAWEADLDNAAVYAAADDAVGECYNDSAFDEAVTINGGGTIGLASVKLSVASGQRHTGTAGTGARIVRSGTANPLNVSNVAAVPLTVEWLDVNTNGLAVAIIIDHNGPSGQITTVRNNLLHGSSGATSSMFGIDLNGTRTFYALNNIVYALTQTAASTQPCAGINLGNTTTATGAHNNTVHAITNNNGSGTCYGISWTDDADIAVKNNCVTDVSGTTTGTKACFNPSAPALSPTSNNLSSDTTASGTGSLTSKTSANQYTSTVVGSEDLHLKAGADAIDAGTDLVTTPTGVNFDIDNRDRDAQGDVWDIGADEYVAAAAATAMTLLLLGVGV